MAKTLMVADPTRTTVLRKAFVREMRRRFRALIRDVKQALVERDVLGLIEGVPFTFNRGLSTNLSSSDINLERQVWRFQTSDQKIKSFKRWLKSQIDKGILEVDATGQPWLAKYIKSAYKKGAIRAYLDAHPELGDEEPAWYRGSKEQFLNSSFNKPERIDKLKLLQTRTFEDLDSITQQISTQMGRILADGLAHGKNPREIARTMSDNISRISRTRAEVICRTEVIYAHAEGQLDGFEELGVEEVGIRAEWLTAGDARVCEECSELEGVVIKVKEAHGLLPRHPNCRCAWVPALGDRKEPGQMWGTKAKKAIERSVRAEGGQAKSDWAGKDLIIHGGDWDESEHPRDERGRFVEKGGGGSEGGGESKGGGGDGEERTEQISFTPRAEYVKDLQAGCREKVKAKGLRARDIDFSFGHRTDPDDVSFAAAEYIESRSSREAMKDVMESQMTWCRSMEAAKEDWKAAAAFGASDDMPRATSEILREEGGSSPDETHLKAFAARARFAQEWLRKNRSDLIDENDDITLYRGIRGKQASSLQEGEKVNLGVYSLSSFTTRKSAAEDFATNYGTLRKGQVGSVVRVKVPVKDVWMLPRDLAPHQIIRFSEDSGEVVLFNKDPVRNAYVEAVYR